MPSLFEPAQEIAEEEAAADLGAAFRGLMQRQLNTAAERPAKRSKRKRNTW